MRRKTILFFCCEFLLLLLLSCGDVFQGAQKKDPVNTIPSSSFVSVAGDSSISLSWTLPSFDGFAKVVLLRKIGIYPLSYSDPVAAKVYEGTDSSFTDTAVTVGNLYCYSLYSVNSKGLYSDRPAMTLKSLVSGFTSSVRNRSFYLIGGASVSGNPFNNLVSAVDAFDPETNIVYPNIATLPIPRYSCAIASANGKIFVFGGLDSKMNLVSEVDVLDVSSSTWPIGVWSKATNMPFSRYSLRAENVDGRIFVFGGSTRISPWPWPSMTDHNHRFDPLSDTWNVDESQVPRLQQYSLMNFVSGACPGHLVYGTGRYNYTSTFFQNIYTLSTEGNFYHLANDNDVGSRASATGVMYYKPLTGGSDITAFFVIGGCSNTGTNFEPLKQTTGQDLLALNTCTYMRMPINAANPVTAMTGKNLNIARAYAEGEAYVNTGGNGKIYVFCGRQHDSPNVLSSYEWIPVDDDFLFTGDVWTEVTITGLSPRFAFDITKVNF